MAADKPDFPAAAAIGQPRKPYRSAKHLLLPPRYHSPAWNTRLDDPEKIFRQSVSHALYRHRTRNTPDRSVPQNRSMGGHPSLFEKPPPVTSLSDDRTQPLYGLLPVVPLALYPSNEVKTENPLTRMIIEKALFPARNTATTPFEDDESNYSFHLSTILFVELLNRFLLNICTLYPFFSILQSIYNLQNHTHDISSKIFYCSATRFRQRRRLYFLANG